MSADIDDVARLRRPPHSIDAEQSVLGAILQDNAAWDRIGDMLDEASFYRHEHRLIFSVIGSLVNSNRPADPVTVAARLKAMPEARDCGLDYLAAMATSVPSASHVRRYAEIVAEHAVERRIIAAADEAAAVAYTPGLLSDKLDKVGSLFASLERRAAGAKPQTLSDIVVRRLARINQLHEQGEETAAWPTPLPGLNRLLTGGLRPGRVYVLAARPSVGKTAFAQALALKCAGELELPVLFLSQEMGADELGDRILSAVGKIDHGRIQTGKLDDVDWSNLSYAAEFAGKLDFFVDDQPALTIGQIRAKARSIPGLRLLVVDYLQLTASAPVIGNRPGATNRNAEIEEVSRGLKTLAKELGIAVLLLSQLNREVEKRPGKKPMMADLRDSGAIEQDADVVMLMWPLQYSATEGCSMVGLEVAKNRGGGRGEIPTCFWGRHMRWGEAELPMTAYTSKAGAQGSDL